MADDGSHQNAIWPLPKFYFQLNWDSQELVFQEVSGLDIESQAIEYRHDNSPQFSTIKMPGIQKSGNITMKKGVFVKDNQFWDWFKQIKMNTIKRLPLTISLLDETGKPTMVWKVANAWPSKITATDMQSDGNEGAIETLEITHEGITIKNG